MPAPRALVCRKVGPEPHLEWEHVDRSEPGPGQLVVAVRAASVGVMDSLMVHGTYQVRPPLPYVPGACGAGDVLAVGPDVAPELVGKPVSFLNYWGAFAEQAVVDHRSAVPIVQGISYEQAACFRLTYDPAYFALSRRAHVAPGETVVVTGATGGVGSAAVRLARRMGARVIAVTSTSAKTRAIEESGEADVVIDISQHVPLREQVKHATEGRGFDVALDVVGGRVFDELTHAVAPMGRIVVMGFMSGDIPEVRTNLLLLKNAAVVGTYFGAWAFEGDRDASRQLTIELQQMATAGSLGVTIGERLPLDRAAVGLQHVVDAGKDGRIVLASG